MRNLRNNHPSAAAAILTLILLAGAATTLGACNTTAGVGEDMSAAGHAVTNSADRNK